MSQDNNKKEILFPKYNALIKKKAQRAKIKELAWKIFTFFCKLLGILYIAFISYLLLSSFFKYEPSDPEERVEKTDYSPYSGWTYE